MPLMPAPTPTSVKDPDSLAKLITNIIKQKLDQHQSCLSYPDDFSFDASLSKAAAYLAKVVISEYPMDDNLDRYKKNHLLSLTGLVFDILTHMPYLDLTVPFIKPRFKGGLMTGIKFDHRSDEIADELIITVNSIAIELHGLTYQSRGVLSDV